MVTAGNFSLPLSMNVSDDRWVMHIHIVRFVSVLVYHSFKQFSITSDTGMMLWLSIIKNFLTILRRFIEVIILLWINLIYKSIIFLLDLDKKKIITEGLFVLFVLIFSFYTDFPLSIAYQCWRCACFFYFIRNDNV